MPIKKERNSTITLQADMNLIAFGRAKIFVTLNRSDKFLVDSIRSPSLTQCSMNPATSYRRNGK